MPQVTLNDIILDLPDGFAPPALLRRLESGEFESVEAAAARARVAPGMPVLDLGGGLGVVSTILARGAGAENLVSVEANPALIPVLRANLERNGQGAARVLHGAVVGGDGGGRSRFQIPRGILGSSLARPGVPEDEVTEVPSLGLQTLLYDHRPELVMMDVEGAEEHLFDQPWNPELRFLVLELHPPRYPERVIKQIVDCMSDTGLTYDPVTSSGRILGFRRVPRRG
ncbi:FkbM family methyltransferase [Rhodobacteraceae bacterium W635]|uniref:FkbM family methyltransferase n=1 Tax=Nioella halotolerans TaxID=2303578 RepID=UPI000E8A932A|nr:FkbM family methyltransferase [Rhodobacteraceae bacterium W635]